MSYKPNVIIRHLSYLFRLEERVGLEGGGPVPLPHHLLSVNVAQQQLRPGECLTVPFRISICVLAFQFEMQIGAQMRRTHCHSPFETHFEQLKIED